MGILFSDNSETKVEIANDGSSSILKSVSVDISSWNCKRTLLRQDEVSNFIHETKGGKYSALLPLLGLHDLEIIAENLRQVSKSIKLQSQLDKKTTQFEEIITKKEEIFNQDNFEQIANNVKNIHNAYCEDSKSEKNPLDLCRDARKEIDKKINGLSEEQKRHIALTSISNLKLKQYIKKIRSANAKLVATVEPLISEKLEVLKSTVLFVDKLIEGDKVDCPACGRSISVDNFREHVNSEQSKLQEIFNSYDLKKSYLGKLSDGTKLLKTNLDKDELKKWHKNLIDGEYSINIEYVDKLNAEDIRKKFSEEDLVNFEKSVLPIIATASTDTKDIPAEAKQLVKDKETIEVGESVIKGEELSKYLARINALITFIDKIEHGVRSEIKNRSKSSIDKVSSSIQSMWNILHPDEEIEDVHLYLPDDIEKAIDIGLTFYGVEQESPRLTLSESYRNSLGLCIFLSMSLHEDDNDSPLFLDDVVVSLDRNHRGMIVELLEKKFKEKQVILLTHDREWYTELRQQLDQKDWVFRTLMPYESPEIGIRWSQKDTSFDDARAHLDNRPDSAGNDARKIMDIELSMIAERLQIKLPYLRAHKNDRRLAHEFLERFISDGNKCFQIKVNGKFEPFTKAIDALINADKLLISWANRSSHTFDTAKPEAIKLINTCETALSFFYCPECKKGIWYADSPTAKAVQCHCGQIRWRYGKG
ncbi:MAG: hypothetical protein K8R67_08635 [Desulfobacteraceae bacterium]|nr:hypothetical protein [Desulfobacteraceae bacterium]